MSNIPLDWEKTWVELKETWVEWKNTWEKWQEKTEWVVTTTVKAVENLTEEKAVSYELPKDTKDLIFTSTKLAQDLTKFSKELKELSDLIKHYNQGMWVVLEEVKNGKKQWKISIFVSEVIWRAKRLKYVWWLVWEVQNIVISIDRNTMQELEEWGLVELEKKYENYVSSIKEQYSQLLENNNFLLQIKKSLESDLQKLPNFTNEIKPDLELLNLQIKQVETSIESYKLSTAIFIKNMPKDLTQLAINLVTYKTWSITEGVINMSKENQELRVKAILASFQQVEGNSKNLFKVSQSNTWKEMLEKAKQLADQSSANLLEAKNQLSSEGIPTLPTPNKLLKK